MDFEVIWTKGAIEDVQHIVDYIARDNPTAALRVGNAIFDHSEILQTFPMIGPAYPSGTRGRKREIHYGNYRIFYEMTKSAKRVDVLAVRHAARDEPTEL